MFAEARRLLKDFSFLLKVHKLIVACVCLHELSKYREYMIPRWLWVIYCIDTSTYAIIYTNIAMAHVFQQPRKLPEFTLFSLGVIFNFTGGVAGVIRAHDAPLEDYEKHRSESKIGILLLGNFIVLFCEIAYIIGFEVHKMREANPATSNRIYKYIFSKIAFIKEEMGNIAIPYPCLRLNAFTPEKKLLIWRTVSMSTCIVGTAVYLRPLEPYLEIPFFGVLAPTYISGYLIINSSEIFMLFTNENEKYTFLELSFAVSGAVGSLICGAYQLFKWISWLVNTTPTTGGDYNLPEFVLALALLLHSISLTAVIIYRQFQRRSNDNDPSATENQ